MCLAHSGLGTSAEVLWIMVKNLLTKNPEWAIHTCSLFLICYIRYTWCKAIIVFMRQLCQYTLIVFYQSLTIKRLEDNNVVHGKYYIIFMVITVLMIFVFCFVSVHWWVNQSIRWWLRKRITQSHLNMNENGAMFNMSQIEHLCGCIPMFICLRILSNNDPRRI